MRIFRNGIWFGLCVMLALGMTFCCSSVFGQTCSGTTVKPTINISTNSTLICLGKSVSFTAAATNCGDHPTYQWKVNGSNVGTNNDSFATSSLKNGDVVNCTVTADPNFPCAVPNKASSYGIVISVSSSGSPSISIAASANDACPGTPITFNATTQNTSSALSFQWKLNEMSVGDSTTVYSSDSLKNNDEIYCVLVDSGGCSVDPVSSNKISVAVKSLPLIIINPSDTSVTSGSIVELNAVVQGNLTSYDWEPKQSLSDDVSFSAVTKPITTETNYFFNAVSVDGCSFSKKITINILHNIIMPNAFTPNNDGHNDVFKIPSNTNIQLQEFVIYNRWGSKVFSTSNLSQGWDGTMNGKNQDAGIYIYTIKGSGPDGKIISSGSLVLIR